MEDLASLVRTQLESTNQTALNAAKRARQKEREHQEALRRLTKEKNDEIEALSAQLKKNNGPATNDEEVSDLKARCKAIEEELRSSREAEERGRSRIATQQKALVEAEATIAKLKIDVKEKERLVQKAQVANLILSDRVKKKMVDSFAQTEGQFNPEPVANDEPAVEELPPIPQWVPACLPPLVFPPPKKKPSSAAKKPAPAPSKPLPPLKPGRLSFASMQKRLLATATDRHHNVAFVKRQLLVGDNLPAFRHLEAAGSAHLSPVAVTPGKFMLPHVSHMEFEAVALPRRSHAPLLPAVAVKSEAEAEAASKVQKKTVKRKAASSPTHSPTKKKEPERKEAPTKKKSPAKKIKVRMVESDSDSDNDQTKKPKTAKPEVVKNQGSTLEAEATEVPDRKPVDGRRLQEEIERRSRALPTNMFALGGARNNDAVKKTQVDVKKVAETLRKAAKKDESQASTKKFLPVPPRPSRPFGRLPPSLMQNQAATPTNSPTTPASPSTTPACTPAVARAVDPATPNGITAILASPHAATPTVIQATINGTQATPTDTQVTVSATPTKSNVPLSIAADSKDSIQMKEAEDPAEVVKDATPDNNAIAEIRTSPMKPISARYPWTMDKPKMPLTASAPETTPSTTASKSAVGESVLLATPSFSVSTSAPLGKPAPATSSLITPSDDSVPSTSAPPSTLATASPLAKAGPPSGFRTLPDPKTPTPSGPSANATVSMAPPTPSVNFDSMRFTPPSSSSSSASTRTPLEEMLRTYKQEQESKEQSLEAKWSEAKLPANDRAIYVNLLKSLFGRLWKCSTPEALSSIASNLSLKRSGTFNLAHESLLFGCIYGLLKKEKDFAEEADFKMYFPRNPLRAGRGGVSVPWLTDRQKRIFTLFATLEQDMGLAGITERFATYLQFSLSMGHRLYNMKLFEAISLVRFYFAVLRRNGAEDRLRSFLVDMTFFRTARSHIFLCILIEVWPEFFKIRSPGHALSSPTKLDPLLEVYVFMVHNSGPETSKGDLKVFDARRLLKETYRLQPSGLTAVDLVKKLIARAVDHIKRVDTLDNMDHVSEALVVMTKWSDFRWAHNNIVTRLMGVLQEKTNNMIIWVVKTLGLVARVFPADGRDQLKELFTPIANLLKGASSAQMEAVCAVALVRIGHHLQVQVAHELWSWTPTFPPLDSAAAAIVQNFLGTRGARHAEETIVRKQRKRRLEMVQAMAEKKSQPKGGGVNKLAGKKKKNKNKKNKKKGAQQQ